MDEIVIGDKKYISSKQAAKATGYAKDYVGQLCREGRVPARLVGRSWYVLETAIQDHRFGEPRNGPIESEKPATVHETSPLQATWESPRYETSKAEILPSVNVLHEGTLASSTDKKDDGPEVAQQLQETWQAWFDRFENTAGMRMDDSVEEKEEEKLEEEPTEVTFIEKKQEEGQNEDVTIPVHTVYEPEVRTLLPDEFLTHTMTPELLGETGPAFRSGGYKKALATIQIAGTMVAAIAVITAVLGSGYLDSYILSSRQVSAVAGVMLYNR